MGYCLTRTCMSAVWTLLAAGNGSFSTCRRNEASPDLDPGSEEKSPLSPLLSRDEVPIEPHPPAIRQIAARQSIFFRIGWISRLADEARMMKPYEVRCPYRVKSRLSG